MKVLHKISILGICFFLLIFQSCRKNYTFDEIDKNTNSFDLDGTFAAPGINSSLKLESLIPDTEQSELWLEIDNNNLIHIKMFYDNYIEYSITEFISGLYPFPIPSTQDVTIADKSIATSPIEMDAYNSMINGTIRFKSPTVKLSFENSIPLSIDMDINSLSFYDESDVVISQITNIQHTITRPEASETVSNSEFILDETSAPGIGAIFSDIPSYAGFDIDFEIATQKPSKDIQGTEDVKVDVEVDLPLEVDMTNLVMGDTVNLDFSKDIYDNVEEVQLKIIIDNGFPLTTDLQLYFASVDGNDIAQTVLDSVFVTGPLTIDGAITDSSGDVQSTTATIATAMLTGDQIKTLRAAESKKMIITGILNTPDATASGGFVNIRSDLEIGLKVGILIRYSESFGK